MCLIRRDELHIDRREIMPQHLRRVAASDLSQLVWRELTSIREADLASWFEELDGLGVVIVLAGERGVAVEDC